MLKIGSNGDYMSILGQKNKTFKNAASLFKILISPLESKTVISPLSSSHGDFVSLKYFLMKHGLIAVLLSTDDIISI